MAEIKETQAAFNVGDKVKITGYYDYKGQAIPAWAKQQTWYVKSIKGDSVIVWDKLPAENKKKKPVIIRTPININDLKAVK